MPVCGVSVCVSVYVAVMSCTLVADLPYTFPAIFPDKATSAICFFMGPSLAGGRDGEGSQEEGQRQLKPLRVPMKKSTVRSV